MAAGLILLLLVFDRPLNTASIRSRLCVLYIGYGMYVRWPMVSLLQITSAAAVLQGSKSVWFQSRFAWLSDSSPIVTANPHRTATALDLIPAPWLLVPIHMSVIECTAFQTAGRMRIRQKFLVDTQSRRIVVEGKMH